MTDEKEVDLTLPLVARQRSPEEHHQLPAGSLTLRRQAYDFLQPTQEHCTRYYSPLFCLCSKAFKWLLLALIIVNVIQAILLNVCYHYAVVGWKMEYLVYSTEVVSVATTLMFTVEYAVRLWSCVEENLEERQHPSQARWKFFLQPLNILDFITASLLWVLMLMPPIHQTGKKRDASYMGKLVVLRVSFQTFLRILLAFSTAFGNIGQSSFRETLSPRLKRRKQHPQQVMEFDSKSEQYHPRTIWTDKKGIWENPSPKRTKTGPLEDDFGFDIKSGRYFRLLLVILAVSSSGISFAVDRGAEIIQQCRAGVEEIIVNAAGFVPGDSCLVDVTSAAAINVALLCSAYLVVQVAPQAAGSGLPEVKCILSGVGIAGFLSRPVLICKSLALMLVLGESLPVGKEGPFVHIASCVANLILETRMFDKMTLPRDDVLLAAVAVGVGSTFSAPVGGVLFALELMMPRLYDTSAYSACFFASTIGTLVYMSLNMVFANSGQLKPLFVSDITAEVSPTLQAELTFIFLCVLIGSICGTLGSIFVQLHKRASWLMSGLRGLTPLFGHARAGASLTRDLLILFIVAVVGASLAAVEGNGLLKLGAGPLLTEIFSQKSDFADQFSQPGPLLWLLVVKAIFTAGALCLPVPAGVVAPSLVLGGLCGHMLATGIPLSIQNFLAPDGNFYAYAVRFAIVGATTFCGSVCRVNSVVVTVFELIAVPRLILPLTLATVAGNFFGNKVGPSIFDSILVMKKIPAMPTLRASLMAEKRVDSVLDKGLMELCLPRYAWETDFENTESILQALEMEGRNLPKFIPIVEEVALHPTRKLLLSGSIKKEDLCHFRPAGGLDLVRVAVKIQDMLQDPMQVSPEMTLKEAYLESMSLYSKLGGRRLKQDGPMLVVEDGMLLGILPHDDLLELAVGEKNG